MFVYEQERRRASQRAALRAAMAFLSASSPSTRAPILPAQSIKVTQFHHHSLDLEDLPADPAVTCFGRLPPSLVRSWSDVTSENILEALEEKSKASLPPPPPLHLPFDETSDKETTRKGFVGAADKYGTRMNEKLPHLLLEALARETSGSETLQKQHMPVVQHVFVLYCLFPEVDGDYAGGSWQWMPRAQALVRENVNEINMLGMGRHQCRMGGTWVGYINIGLECLMHLWAFRKTRVCCLGTPVCDSLT